MTISHITRPPITIRTAEVVAIVDPGRRLDRLDAYLPLRWTVHSFPSLYDVDRPDLLVLSDATPFLVVSARLLFPHATVIGVIDPDAPARLFIDVLHSGADACVRGGALHILAAHLLEGHRRRLRRSTVR